MLSSRARGVFAHVTEPAGRRLARAGISPDAITLLGLAGSLLAAVLVALGMLRWGGVLLLLAGLADMLDGAVAKASGPPRRWGAFLDSVTDRVSDAAVVVALLWLAAVTRDPALALLEAAVLVGAFMVSYVRARAEALGFTCNVGIAERPERVLVFGIALITGLIDPALWLLLVATLVTVGQRIVAVGTQSRRDAP